MSCYRGLNAAIIDARVKETQQDDEELGVTERASSCYEIE